MNEYFAEGYRIREQSAPHFLTFTIAGWIDLFTRKCYKDLLLQNMQYCRQYKGLMVHAYVIMSNHVHVIWQAKNNNLSDIIRDFKSFTSKKLIAMMQEENESRREWLQYMFQYFANGTNQNEHFKIWETGNHPEAIYTADFMLSKLNYIHQNPVRAGWVEEAKHYLYSSAANYAGHKGLMAVDLLY